MAISAHPAGAGYVIGGLPKLPVNREYLLVGLYRQARSCFFDNEVLESWLAGEFTNPAKQCNSAFAVPFIGQKVRLDCGSCCWAGSANLNVTTALGAHQLPADGDARPGFEYGRTGFFLRENRLTDIWASALSRPG